MAALALPPVFRLQDVIGPRRGRPWRGFLRSGIEDFRTTARAALQLTFMGQSLGTDARDCDYAVRLGVTRRRLLGGSNRRERREGGP